MLQEGGSALDMVQVATEDLENNPLYNPGPEQHSTVAREIQMDTSVMEGLTLAAGAVATVHRHSQSYSARTQGA
jgi:beta-aspartyl-peptidase (threonine type)